MSDSYNFPIPHGLEEEICQWLIDNEIKDSSYWCSEAERLFFPYDSKNSYLVKVFRSINRSIITIGDQKGAALFKMFWADHIESFKEILLGFHIGPMSTYTGQMLLQWQTLPVPRHRWFDYPIMTFEEADAQLRQKYKADYTEINRKRLFSPPNKKHWE